MLGLRTSEVLLHVLLFFSFSPSSFFIVVNSQTAVLRHHAVITQPQPQSQTGPQVLSNQIQPQQMQPQEALPQEPLPRQLAQIQQAQPQQFLPQQALPQQAQPQQPLPQQAQPQQAQPQEPLPQQAQQQQEQTRLQLALQRQAQQRQAQLQQAQQQQSKLHQPIPQTQSQPQLPQTQQPQPRLPQPQLPQQQPQQGQPQQALPQSSPHHHGGGAHLRGQLPPGTSREFLEAHNKIRSDHGEPPLIWSNKLARFAHRHGSKIITSPNCMNYFHSDGPYGENLFWSKQAHWTPTDIVKSWAQEMKSYDYKTNTCSDTTGSGCGHYTQIVWWDTTSVGCQLLQCHPPGVGFIGVCNYDPPGNVEGQGPWSNAPNKMPPRMPATPL